MKKFTLLSFFAFISLITLPSFNKEAKTFPRKLDIQIDGKIKKIKIDAIIESLFASQIKKEMSSKELEAMTILLRTQIYHAYLQAEGKAIPASKIGYRMEADSSQKEALRKAIAETGYYVLCDSCTEEETKISSIILREGRSIPKLKISSNEEGMPVETCLCREHSLPSEKKESFSPLAISQVDDENWDASDILLEQLPHLKLLSLEQLLEEAS